MAQLQELCTLLVEDTCGNLCSQIFSLLAEKGRLSRLHLQSISRIPPRQLRPALAVLIQQHLVLHYTAPDDEDVTYYQVDWRNSYNLARSHRIISLVQDRHGEPAGKVVANLLQLGHARVGDLAQAFDLAPTTSQRDSGIDLCNEHVNGDAKHTGTDPQKALAEKTITTVAQFHNTLRVLLRDGFLVKLSKKAYMPTADREHEIKETIIADQFPDRKITGPKKQAEFKTAVNNLKRKWRDADEYSDSRDTENRGVIRRPGVNPAKRTKLNGDVSYAHGENRDETNVAKLPNDLVLRVNYSQCTKAFRTQRLEQMAEPYLGGVTASVYGALLQALEAKMRTRDDDVAVEENPEDEEDDLPTASLTEIAEILDPTLDLTLGIQGAAELYKLPNGDARPKKKGRGLDPEFADIGIKQEESDSDNDHPMNGYTSLTDRNKRFSLIEEHLKLLEEHSKGFCRRVGGGGRGEWRVNFPALTDTLIQADIDSTVLARFSRTHTRILRLLRECGRLEEKQLSTRAMMRMKDLRALMTELQYVGLVEVQEVPKDATRQSGRMHYLWFHDQHRVQSILLQQTYQGMARILQRLKQERENYKNAIEKAEMMDVKQEALAQNEREAVMQWREVEEKLLIQLQRMDEMVALLRDFSGKDKSLLS